MKSSVSRSLARYWASTDKKTRELSQAIWSTYYFQGEPKNPHTAKKPSVEKLLKAAESVYGQRKIFIREKPETIRKKRRGKAFGKRRVMDESGDE